MTETLIYGVRYTVGVEQVVDAVDSLNEAMDAIRNLFAEQGQVAEIVSKPENPWLVNASATLQAKRNLVEETLDVLVQGEIDEEEAAAQLHYMASGLLSDTEAKQHRAAGLHVPDDCTMAIWLERAANLYRHRIDPPPGKDPNDEAYEADYLSHLDVLAGVVDHGREEYDCSSCARTIPAMTSRAVA